MNRCLITGFAGFIGSHLTRRLLEQDYKITGVDNLVGSEFNSVNTKIDKYFINDFNSAPILKMIRNQEFDYVFHLAALPRVAYSVENPALTNKTNVQDTIELLEACRGNIKRFIFSSSSSVYGGADILPTPTNYPKSPKSPYAIQKSVCEDYLKIFSNLYGLETISLRYYNVFGKNNSQIDNPYSTLITSWIRKMKNNRPLRFDGDGTQTRDMCHVDNVVSANILSMNSNKKFQGECFNVACGESTSNNEILKYFKNKYGFLEIDYQPERLGDVKHTLADISETKKILGYKVLVSFWDGLEKTLKEENLW